MQELLEAPATRDLLGDVVDLATQDEFVPQEVVVEEKGQPPLPLLCH